MTPAEIHLTLGEGIEAAVALGTFALAFVTWRMAVATRKMANSADEQMELLRRQTEAAEHANIHAEKRLEAESKPVLNISRSEGQQITGGSTEDGRWTVMMRNEGLAPATLQEARVRLAPQELTLDPIPPVGVIPPGKQLLFSTAAPREVLDGEIPMPISFTYSGPTGDRFNTQALIIGKDGGTRWLVSEREKHKSAGR